jgi:hypothetical protein
VSRRKRLPKEFKPLVGLKQLAAYCGKSVSHLKWLLAEGRARRRRGIDITPNLLPKNGRRYLPIPEWRAILIKSLCDAYGDIDHAGRDPETGRWSKAISGGRE